MDIQKEREAFQKEMLDSKYVAGNISAFWDEKTQNYDIAITELRMAWYAWQAAKAQAVPKGFVVVSREMPKSFDEGLYVYSNSISIIDECSDGFIPMSDINHAEVWKLVIEAQEQNQ